MTPGAIVRADAAFETALGLVLIVGAATGRLGPDDFHDPVGTPVIVTFAPQKFDEATLELKDQPTRDMIKLQLAAFAKFIERVSGR